MTSRRVPLSANPNVANSPLRGAAASFGAPILKQRRSHASTQREETYGQPPPAKRQMLEPGARTALRSPSKTRTLVQRGTSRSVAPERVSQSTTVHKPSEKEVEEVRKWQQNQRSRFPKLVFYFESIPDDQRVKLAKQVAHLGAREAKFFSIDITHVVTSRSIPPEKPVSQKEERVDSTEVEHEQPQTINPSLLSRSADVAPTTTSLPTKRRLFENATSRRMPLQAQEEAVRRLKPSRNADVLHRAREMGKKIWSLDKLQKVLDMLLEVDPYRSAALGFYGSRGTASGASRATEGSTLVQLLNKERVNGPSDRDPTVATRELNYFKGPYLYVYDIEEKQKPIMVREYNKVADKKLGDWPQFRASSTGRCPFVDDYETAAERKERQRAKEAAVKPAVEAAPRLQPPAVEAPKAVTGKRSLAEMEDGQNRRPSATVQPTEIFDAAKAARAPSVDFQPQNAFTSRAKTGLFFAGEPVASGVQPSGITSAIRSQMISSATGTLGSKAGTSKEIHGLQRKVLQKSAPTSQDLSSRRMMTETSMDPMSYTRSQSLGRVTQRKLDLVDEQSQSREEKHKRTYSVPVQVTKQKKRDPKPGYCENCQDKFDDFDEHILSRKHRKFAENDDNWTHLDALLSQLKRIPKYEIDGEDDGW